MEGPNPFEEFVGQPARPPQPEQPPVSPNGPATNPFEEFARPPTPPPSNEPSGNVGDVLRAGAEGIATAAPNALLGLMQAQERGQKMGLPFGADVIGGMLEPAITPVLEQITGKKAIPLQTPRFDEIHKGLESAGMLPEQFFPAEHQDTMQERIARMGVEGALLTFLPGNKKAGLERIWQIGKEMLAGGAGGATAQLGMELAPEKWKPTAGLVGGLVGGVGAAVPLELAEAGVKSAAAYTRPAMAARSDKSAEAQAAERLANVVGPDRASVIEQLDNRRPTPSGAPETSAQATGNQRLGMLERALARGDETFRATLNEQRATQSREQLRMINEMEQSGVPVSVANYLNTRMRDLEQHADDLYTTARNAAQRRAEELGDPQAADVGAGARAAINERLGELGREASKLWKSIDPDHTTELLTKPLLLETARIYGGMTPERALSIAPAEIKIASMIGEYGPTLPFDRFIDLRSHISAAMREVNGALQPNKQAAARLSQLRSAIEQAVEDSVNGKVEQERQAVANGTMNPDDTLEARFLRQVKDWYAEQGKTGPRALAGDELAPRPQPRPSAGAGALGAEGAAGRGPAGTQGDQGLSPDAGGAAPANLKPIPEELRSRGLSDPSLRVDDDGNIWTQREDVRASRNENGGLTQDPNGTEIIPGRTGRTTARFEGRPINNINEIGASNAQASPDGRAGVRPVSRAPEGPEGDAGRQAGREPDGSLRGLPKYVRGDLARNVPSFKPSAHPEAQRVAENYMKKAGLPYNPPNTYVKVNPRRAKRIADAYDAMEHDPQNPAVKRAYDAMAKETLDQYQAMLDAGMQIEFIPAGAPDPYAGNPRNMIEDVRNNKHMWVFPTKDGFGSDATFDASDNPLLADSGFQISGQPATVNDIFRAVHDYFGHVKEGVGFRADGEENAWRAHSAMYSDEARKAMTSETRGQNSWVNYGPYGETNRTARSEDTHYADQKIGILPDWAITEGAGDYAGVRQEFFKRLEDVGVNKEEANANAALVDAFYSAMAQRLGKTREELAAEYNIPSVTREEPRGPALEQIESPAFKRWFAGSKVVDENGDPMVVYHATNQRDEMGQPTNFDVFHVDNEMGAHFGNERQADDRISGYLGHPRVYPVYLSIKNPLRVRDAGEFGNGDPTLANELRRRNIITHMERQYIQELSDHARSREQLREVDMQLKKMLQDKGYDGLVYLNRNESLQNVNPDYHLRYNDQAFKEEYPEAADSYVAFEPTQIKSAIANRGTYDPNNPSILTQKVIKLDDFREQKQLKEFHGDLMNRVRQRAQEIAAVTKAAREKGVFKGVNVGDRLTSRSVTGRELPPMKVEAVFMREWTGRPMQVDLFKRLGVEPTIVEFNGRQYVPMARVLSGDENGPDWSRSDAYLDLLRGRKMEGPRPVGPNTLYQTARGEYDPITAYMEKPHSSGLQTILREALRQSDGQTDRLPLIIDNDAALYNRGVEILRQHNWNEESVDNIGGVGAALMEIVKANAPTKEEWEAARNATGAGAAKGKAPVFYSAVGRAVENSKQLKASPEQWLATIKKGEGIKPEELEWLNLEGWMAAQKRPGQNAPVAISKDQLLDYIDANKIEITETRLMNNGFDPDSAEGLDIRVSNFEPDEPDWDWINENARERADDMVDEIRDELIADYARNLGVPDEEIQALFMPEQMHPDMFDGETPMRTRTQEEIELRDEIEQEAKDKALEKAQQIEEENYYEDPNSTATVTVRLPDGSRRNYTVTREPGWAGGGEIYDHENGSNLDNWNGEFDDESISDAIRESLAEELGDLGPPEGVEGAVDGPTKFESFRLKGGEDYTELLLRIPEREPARYAQPSDEVHARYQSQWDDLNARMEAADEINDAFTVRALEREADALRQKEINETVATSGKQKFGANFTNSHFDQSNVVVHTRFDTRTIDGKRSLFLQEVQSDWHQKGRKRGYALDRDSEAFKKLEEDYSQALDALEAAKDRITKEMTGFDSLDALKKARKDLSYEETEKFDAMSKQIDEIIKKTMEIPEREVFDKAEDALSRAKSPIPDAPFKKTEAWAGLALKRMLRYAAENGYEQMVWFPGDLENGSIITTPVNNLTYTKHTFNGDTYYKVKQDNRYYPDNMTPQEVANRFGSKIAEKMAAGDGDPGPADFGDGAKIINTPNMRVGGHLQQHYGKIIPNELARITKKFDAPIGRTMVKANGENIQAMVIPITDKMRDAVLNEGQPLFQGAKRGYIQFNDKSPLLGILREADPSTVPHELGHHFLKTFQEIALGDGAPKAIREDWRIVKNWWKKNAVHVAADSDNKAVTPNMVHRFLDNGSTGSAQLDEAIQVGMQEQWARAFEAYLRNGEAPSVGLKRVFEQFKTWLTQVYKSLTQLNVDMSPEIKGVFDRMLGKEEGSVAQPAPKPGPKLMNVEQGKRLMEATAATKNLKQQSAKVGRIIRTTGTAGDYRMPDEAVAKAVWGSGPQGAANVRTALEVSGGKAKPAIEQAAILSLKPKMKDGLLKQDVLDAWRRNHADALRAFPELDKRLQTAASATKAMEDIAEARKTAIDTVQKSAIGKLLKLNSDADVAKTVGGMLGKPTAVKDMRELVGAARRDPDALSGLRRAVIDYALDHITLSKDAISADKFIKFIRNNHAALAEVMSPEQMNHLRALMQELKRASKDFKAPGGGSDTAENLMGIKKHVQEDVKVSILRRLFVDSGAMAGVAGATHFVTGGSSWPLTIASGIVSALGSDALQSARNAGLRRIDELVQEAVLNPDLMRALLAKAPNKANTGSHKTLAAMLGKIGAVAAMSGSNEAGDQRREQVNKGAANGVDVLDKPKP